LIVLREHRDWEKERKGKGVLMSTEMP